MTILYEQAILTETLACLANIPQTRLKASFCTIRCPGIFKRSIVRRTAILKFFRSLFPIKQHDHLETLFNVDPFRIRIEQQCSPLFCQTECSLKLFESREPVFASAGNIGERENVTRSERYRFSRDISRRVFPFNGRSAPYFIFFGVVNSLLLFYLCKTIVRRDCHLAKVPFSFSRYVARLYLMFYTLAHFGRHV